MSTVESLPRPDWRESLSLATDLCLLGIVTTLACLPVVTAGGALATASVAVSHTSRYRSLPSTMDMLGTFRRALLPGLGASLVLGTGLGLVLLDLRWIAAGVVPGGPAMLAATALLGLAGLVFAAVTLAQVGVTGGRGWRRAGTAALQRLRSRPWLGPALASVLLVVAVLAAVIPVTVPLLVAMALFALHVLVRPA